MSGYIALHRALLEWEWYSELNTCRVFIHCLLKANWKDKNYRGKVVKRGHFLTSLEVMAQETGLSVRNVRTAIKNLKATNELTVISTSQGTEIIVNNYDSYQEPTDKPTHELTDERQTSDKQVTSTNKGNKGNKVINNKGAAKKTRLKAEFELPVDWVESATNYWSKAQCFDLSPQAEFEAFKNHHIAKASTSADWKRSWATWYSNALKFIQEKRGRYANSQQPNQQPKLSNIEAAGQINAEYARKLQQQIDLEASDGNGEAVAAAN